MSIAALVAAARRELAALKTATCCVTRAADGFAAPGVCVACHYGETPPRAGGRLDAEGGGGDGYTVWFDADVAIDVRDVVAVDGGPELQVTRVVPTGNLSTGPRVEATAR